MPQSIRDFLNKLHFLAPLGCAESWDNVGLLVGSEGWSLSRAVVSIDLTHEALDQAIAQKAELILLHHPPIFPKGRGLDSITDKTFEGELILNAIQHKIAIVSCHTNFDQGSLEASNQIAAALGVIPKGRLSENSKGSISKLSVFVPESHIENIRTALCDAGAGQIGNYDFCTFQTVGEGTFRGNAFTNPHLGKPEVLERVKEIRLETVFPTSMTKIVVEALLNAHPYEEVAYDLFPLLQNPTKTGMVKGLGYGFWGDFEQDIPFSEVLQRVKRAFNIDGYLLTEPLNWGSQSAVKRIAFSPGKGSSFVESAKAMGADVFITGEVGYHGALWGARRELSVIEIGHRESECFTLKVLSEWCEKLGVPAQKISTHTQRIVKV